MQGRFDTRAYVAEELVADYLCQRCIVKWEDIWESDGHWPDLDIKTAIFWSVQLGDRCPKCDMFCTPYFTDDEAEE